MEVILLDNIANLGGLGDKVTVKGGFGRNFLFPQGKALRATAANLEEFERRRADLEQSAAERESEAHGLANKIAGLTVTIPANAGEEGKLFGSVGTLKIAEAISEAAQVTIEKSMVNMPEGVFRDTGEYEVEIQLHNNVTQIVKVAVVPE